MFPAIEKYLQEISQSLTGLSSSRKAELDQLAQIISTNPSKDIVFICTHNSRRSHLAQVWMQVACKYIGLENTISTFSGGTEATALNPRTAAALKRVGFNVSQDEDKPNPIYKIGFHQKLEPIKAFSKIYSHKVNPQSNFIAIMTCDEAAETCPAVQGASRRFNLTYKDPKLADESPEEQKVYDERCREIATEMLYLAEKSTISTLD